MGGLLSGLGGGVIGGAVVRLFLDDKSYQTGLAKADAEGKSATSSIGKSFSALKMIGVAVFAALAAAAVKFAVDAIAAAREHEIAVQQLTRAVGGNAEALQKQASALQMVTGYSDEAIMSATTILSRYDLIAKQLKELNPLVLDYARATGQDVPAAAGAIGKALLGNARALKALGIDYQLTGNKAQDTANLMALLEEKVGGVAEAFGQTSQGQAEILNQKFDEFKETIGTGLLPIIEQFKQGLIALGPTLEVVGKAVVFGLGAVNFMIASIHDAIFSLLQVVDTVLGPLYSFDGATDHAAKAAEAAMGAFDENSRSLETQSVGYDNAAAHAVQYAHKVGGARAATMKFAHMTGDELMQWLETTKQSFEGADTVWDKFADNRKVNVRDILHAFRQQNKALKNYEDNVETLRAKGLEDQVLESLGNMGLEGKRILEGLSGASKKEIDKVNSTFDTNVERAGTVSKSLAGVSHAVRDLNGARANAEVNVHYTYTGYDGSMPGMSGGH